MNSVLIIPTLNAGPQFKELLKSIAQQSYQPDYKVVVDSGSKDNTVELAKEYNFEIISIKASEFNHGGTRQKVVDLFSNCEIAIFLTQDAILSRENSLEKLMECFSDKRVGAAYGRQLPHINAKPLGAHARLFNYPEKSRIKCLNDRKELGIKTAFISNSFAAYRISALTAVGGFPENTILSEDTYVAAKMLLEGWKIYYSADATVFHSHDYSIKEEFKRYFDIGVFYSREKWIIERFGKAEGEGLKFVISELQYLLKNRKLHLIPSSIFRSILKLVGFKLGSMENFLPLSIKKKISMHRTFWTKS
ncbi:glycosyltransferase [Geobacillus thermodenitrificans]|uniref:glycosyltransferase n=1 Tax=Anoxybacillaceae TaxID=3120669 RepID=UPI003D1C107B